MNTILNRDWVLWEPWTSAIIIKAKGGIRIISKISSGVKCDSLELILAVLTLSWFILFPCEHMFEWGKNSEDDTQ